MLMVLLALGQPVTAASNSLFPSRLLGSPHRSPPTLILPKPRLPPPPRPAARPEVRSYRPYSGLQYGFRPTPPVERSVRASEPEITMPKRVEPLVRNGRLSLGYSYCAEPPANVGLPSAPFSGAPAPSRTCP
jgi:hypothetical protein